MTSPVDGPFEIIGPEGTRLPKGAGLPAHRTMIKQLLEEVRSAPWDEASRTRLKDIPANSIRELEDGLSPELRDELDRLVLPFDELRDPSDAEPRIAQAHLVGWLEGVFHRIQATEFAQQVAHL